MSLINDSSCLTKLRFKIKEILTGEVGVLGHDGLTLAMSRSSGNGEEDGEIPDSGVGGADDLFAGAIRRFFSGSSCCGFSKIHQKSVQTFM